MEKDKKLPHSDLTGSILNCCFEVMKELGPGFVESIYKNAILIAMRQKGLLVEVGRSFEVVFRGTVIGRLRWKRLMKSQYRFKYSEKILSLYR